MTTPDGTDRPSDDGSGHGLLEFADLTARARIREAALKHFAEDGYERATVRSIARTAGVSPGLLRHHYGSKHDLRQACDDYAFESLQRLNEQLLVDPGQSASTRLVARRFGRYVARSLAEGSTTATPMFDKMVDMTELWLARADAERPIPPSVDRRTRAALMTAMALGVPLLHEHLTRVLSVDIFGPDGDRLVALGLLDIYSHAVINEEVADATSARFTATDARFRRESVSGPGRGPTESRTGGPHG